jgi:tetratricopeptide (TPR) repeat protein
MLSKTKLFAGFILLTGILFGSFLNVSAQETQEKIKVSAKEAKAVEKIEKAKTIDEKMQLISAFMKEFPQSPARKQVVDYAAAQITQLTDDSQVIQQGNTYLAIFAQPEDADLILPSMVYSFIQLKRPKEAFDTGQKYLARHPEDVTTRLRLAVEGSNQLRMGTKDYAAAARDAAAKAIELVEADKRPANINETGWQEYKTKWLPQLYQSIGIIELDAGDKAKARTNLEKAASLAPKDVNSWILLGSMTDEEYQTVALKYNAAAAGAERDALLAQANEKMDATIEIFARIVALTDGKPEAKQINEQVRENLEGYYKYRHKNTDGLQALIDKYKK